MRQADDADALLARPLDAEGHRLGADHLAVAALPVEGQQGAGITAHRHVRIGGQAAFENGVDVTRDHADAVRVVAAQVRLDEVGRDPRSFVRHRAGGGDDGTHRRGQRIGAEDMGFDHAGPGKRRGCEPNKAAPLRDDERHRCVALRKVAQ